MRKSHKAFVFILAAVLICGCMGAQTRQNTADITFPDEHVRVSQSTTTTLITAPYDGQMEATAMRLMDDAEHAYIVGECRDAMELVVESNEMLLSVFDQMIMGGEKAIHRERIRGALNRSQILKERIFEICMAQNGTSQTGNWSTPKTIIPSEMEIIPYPQADHILRLKSTGCENLRPYLETFDYGADGSFFIRARHRFILADIGVSDDWGICGGISSRKSASPSDVDISAICRPQEDTIRVFIEYTSWEGYERVKRTCRVEQTPIPNEKNPVDEILDRYL